MKSLARQKRCEFAITSPRVGLSDLRRIYRHEGVRIDLWPHKTNVLQGAYFNDEDGVSVMIAKSLPEDPRAFTMAHELKHHFVDSEMTVSYCSSSNEPEMIEIGAEVFAAELLFPEEDFSDRLRDMNVGRGNCSAEDLVKLKRETRTTLSYAGLAKRAVFLGFAAPGAFTAVRWKRLEESIYGIPFYKQRSGGQRRV